MHFDLRWTCDGGQWTVMQRSSSPQALYWVQVACFWPLLRLSRSPNELLHTGQLARPITHCTRTGLRFSLILLKVCFFWKTQTTSSTKLQLNTHYSTLHTPHSLLHTLHSTPLLLVPYFCQCLMTTSGITAPPPSPLPGQPDSFFFSGGKWSVGH